MTRRRLTWKGRLLLAALAAPFVGGGYAWFAADGWRLDAYRARLDRDEPGWRWADIRAGYEAGLPPDDRNPLTVAQAVDARRAQLADLDLRVRLEDDEWLNRPGAALNHRPPADERAGLGCLYEPLAPVLADARRLADVRGPTGNRYAFTPDLLMTSASGVMVVPPVAGLLRFDAVMLALDGDADAAVVSVRAMLGAARAIGDDPFSVAQTKRMSAAQLAVATAEWVFAVCEPAAGLTELQAELAAEAEHPRLRFHLRGERAVYDHFLDNFRTGRDDVPAFLTRIGGCQRSTLPERVRYRLTRDRDHRAFLDWTTRMLRVLDFPEHEWPARANELPPEPAPLANLGFCGFCLSRESLVLGHLRWTARLRAAAAGLACERFRRQHGRWPASLSEAAAVLPAVPRDPFRDAPLLLRRVPGGLVVYSVGPDGRDDGGTLSDLPQPDTDVGFRLFDPDRRNLPSTEDRP